MSETLNILHNHVDDFNQTCGRVNAKLLRVLQWNVRGINDLNKFDNVLLTLDHLVVPIDVIIIGESWIKDGNTAMYNIRGYNSIFSCRESSNGGLAVYIRDTIEFKLVKNECFEGFHHINVELMLPGGALDVHGVYRPPSFDFNLFCENLESWFNQNSNNRPCLIFGDVNVPVNMSNHNTVLKYKYLLQSYGYLCSNTFATRPASSNILDHVLCKMVDAHRLSNHTIPVDLSDHSLILSEFKTQLEFNKVRLTKKIINHEQLRIEFKRYMENVGPINDVNTCLQNILSKYNTILNSCTKTVATTAKIKGTQCPWMTFDLWNLMKIKNSYLKKSRRDPNNIRLVELLKHVSKKLDFAKKQAKRNYFERLLNNTSHSKLWKNVNAILGKSQSKSQLSLEIDGNRITDSKTICEAFNDHFSTIGLTLAENITKTNANPLRHINPISSSIFLQPSTVNEVVLLINDLKTSKSPGPDNLTAQMVKDNVASFSRILSESFNLIIQTGIYPNCLKLAKVIPIFKSGDPSKPDNYRPISTLSVLNKIFEKLLINRMVHFLDIHNILYSMQYGFRSGSSTTVAITELVDKILEETDLRRYVGALFLDLKKAFDTLNHGILLRKLEHYGIRGVANDVIRSYLENRSQLVSYAGEMSSYRQINVGVPQGSNIGPLLFLIYINDISKLHLTGVPRLFADDTALFYPNIDPNLIIANMHYDLQVLQNYFCDNLLSLNLQKTKYMIFRSPRKTLPNLPDLVMDVNVIERVDSFKYLGIHLDCILSWDYHIKKLAGKISTMCGILKRISHFVPRKVLFMFYFAHVHSHLNYLIIAWGRACKSKLKKLQTLQNRCIKIIYNLPWLFSSVRLYTDFPHKILPIQGMCDEQTLLLIHNMLHNPKSIHNLNINVLPRLHNTRQTHNLSRSRVYSNFGQKRFTFIGPSKFNNLPRDVKTITNRLLFKSTIKRLLISQVSRQLI